MQSSALKFLLPAALVLSLQAAAQPQSAGQPALKPVPSELAAAAAESEDNDELQPLFAAALNPQAQAAALQQQFKVSGTLLPAASDPQLQLVPLKYLDALLQDDARHNGGLVFPFLVFAGGAGSDHLDACSRIETDGRSAQLAALEQRSAQQEDDDAVQLGLEDLEEAGLAWLYLQPELAAQGLSLNTGALPRQGLSLDLKAVSMRTLLQNLAFYSHVDDQGFRLPATPFDQHIYSRFTERMINGDKLSALGQGCSFAHEENCGLYFTGAHVSAVLKDAGVSSPFYIKDDLYGIPLRFDEHGQPQLILRAALSSDWNYVNYGNLMELELAVLQDLGFNVNPRRHYGRSIYTFGTREEPLRQQLSFAYGDINHAGDYTLRPNSAPLAVGLHLYGSYNDILAGGTVTSSGIGSIGVRADGSYNRLTLPFQSYVRVTGPRSMAAALTNGHDNVLQIDGVLSAPAADGIALSADYGSNIYSDLTEAQGSWQRSRSIPAAAGDPAAALPLLPPLEGPLAQKINISGRLEGGQAAIYAAPGAYVGEINLTGRAQIYGNIEIAWHPQPLTDDLDDAQKSSRPLPLNLHAPTAHGAAAGNFYGRLPHKSACFIGTQLHLPDGVKPETLTTRLNLGISKVAAAASGPSEPAGDPRANILINGDVQGPALEINQPGGRAQISGALQARSLTVRHGLMRLNLPAGEQGRLQQLQLGARGVLDLLNGRADTLIIDRAAISRTAAVRVDAAPDGTIMDQLIITHDAQSSSGYLTLEPGVSFDALKRLSADPRQFLSFMTTFSSSANYLYKDLDIFVAFPNQIWLQNGTYGRETRCSARGCRAGNFVKAYAQGHAELPFWRYALSIGGLAALVLGTVLYFKLTQYFSRRRMRLQAETQRQ